VPTRRDLGAALVLVAHGFLLLMAPPILDYLQIEPKRAWGPFVALRDLDGSTRGPLVRAMVPAEAVLGTSQTWHFYKTGASKTRHFEIWVDGTLWHRSNDPEHAFMAGPLANARVRHHVKDWVRGRRLLVVEPALLHLVVARVREADPNARRVELRAMEGRWPGTRQQLARSASAPIHGATAPGGGAP
jgi:hypothetical protein